MPGLVASLDLEAPLEGSQVLRHDATFERWDAVFVRVRDGVNEGLSVLAGLGVDLPRLPGGTLAELVVDPLVGDCAMIRANADACRRAGDAVGELAVSAGRVAAATVLDWRGAAGLECGERLGVDAVALGALGEAVAAGHVVFDRIALVCERLAVTVERGVVRLGHAVARLAERLIARLAGGGVGLAAEIALRGWDAVTDIVDDVRTVIAVIEELRHLQQTVAAWAEDRAAQLQDVLDLGRVLASLGSR